MTILSRAAAAETTGRMRMSGAILVVHRDPQVLRVVGQILGRGGYPVLQARTGADAVRLYDQHSNRIGLVLLDAVTPELARLTGAHPGLPFLGLSEPDTPQRFPFLLQPFTPGALLDAVRHVMAAAHPLS